MSKIHIVSTSVTKSPAEMNEEELSIAIADITEVVEYLTREDASYEERCYAENVRVSLNNLSEELGKRRT